MYNTFFVSVWKNGKAGKKNLSYGLSIPKKIKETYFKEICEIILIINNIETVVDFRDGFENKCSEIASDEITKFLLENELTCWEKGFPPKIEIRHIESNKFKLLSIESKKSPK